MTHELTTDITVNDYDLRVFVGYSCEDREITINDIEVLEGDEHGVSEEDIRHELYQWVADRMYDEAISA